MRYALLIFFLLTSLASGQTKTVLKNLSNNALTESFVVPSGASITISPEASIINQGTATGFTTGSVSWSAITNKPTTVAGFGISDALTTTVAASTYLTSSLASSTYQPLDVDLTNIAALTTTTFGRSLLTQADALAARTALGLPLATQAEMEAGTVTATRSMSPKLVADAIAALGGSGSSIPLPVSVANGGTGSTTPQAARVALGTETLVPGVAQVVGLNIESTPTYEWNGLYVDIHDGTSVCRFWVNTGPGDVPPTPAGGRLQMVYITGSEIIDVETAFLAAFSAQSSAFTATGSGTGQITVTNVTAAAAPAPAYSSPPLPITLSVSTNGVDPYRELPSMDGSQLYNVSVSYLPSPGPATRGGVYASDSFTGQYVKGLSTNGDLIYSTGAMPIANGGTGQTAKTAAFDALAPTTTKGDLIVHNGTDNVRLAVGPTNGHVLTVDSTQANGIRWLAPSGGGSGAMVLLASATASSSADITFDSEFDSSLYSEYVLKMQGVQPATDNVSLRLQLRNSTPASITDFHRNNRLVSQINASLTVGVGNTGGTTGWELFPGAGNATNELSSITVHIQPISGQWTHMNSMGYITNNSTERFSLQNAGACEGTTAPAGVKIYMSSGNIARGAFQLYGITK